MDLFVCNNTSIYVPTFGANDFPHITSESFILKSKKKKKKTISI